MKQGLNMIPPSSVLLLTGELHAPSIRPLFVFACTYSGRQTSGYLVMIKNGKYW